MSKRTPAVVLLAWAALTGCRSHLPYAAPATHYDIELEDRRLAAESSRVVTAVDGVDAVLAGLYGVETPRGLIQVRRELAYRADIGPASITAGYYQTAIDTVQLRSSLHAAGETQATEGVRLENLAHELTHRLNALAFDGPMPFWLDEGLARALGHGPGRLPSPASVSLARQGRPIRIAEELFTPGGRGYAAPYLVDDIPAMMLAAELLFLECDRDVRRAVARGRAMTHADVEALLARAATDRFQGDRSLFWLLDSTSTPAWCLDPIRSELRTEEGFLRLARLAEPSARARRRLALLASGHADATPRVEVAAATAWLRARLAEDDPEVAAAAAFALAALGDARAFRPALAVLARGELYDHASWASPGFESGMSWSATHDVERALRNLAKKCDLPPLLAAPWNRSVAHHARIEAWLAWWREHRLSFPPPYDAPALGIVRVR